MTLFQGYPTSLGLSPTERLPDFACLRPTGGLAESCMDEWLACSSADGSGHAFHKFLYSSCCHCCCPVPGLVSTDVPLLQGAAAVAPIAGPGAEPHRHTAGLGFRGGFRLNLSILGRNAAGWVLGSNSTLDEHGPAAKFVACTQAKADSTKIAAVHVRFNFNAYGVLTATPATKEGFGVVTSEGERRICGTSYPLVQPTTLLKIGECNYVFSYLPQVRSPFHLSALCRHMEQTRAAAFELPAPVANLAAPSNMSLYGYAMDKGILGPATGVAHAGLDKATGTPVDVMRLTRSGANKREFATIKILKHIKKISSTPPSIVRLREIVDEHSPVEVVAIFEPLLTTTLDDAIDSQSLSEKQSIVVFHQCLEGVAWLHNNGIMHRSLSPATIALKSRRPVAAFIHDFGHARVATMCRAKDVPPTSYLAPEMLLLNLNPRARPYDSHVDLWALGMTALALLNQRLWTDCDLEMHDGTFYPDMSVMLMRLKEVDIEVAEAVHFLLRHEPHNRFPAWLAAESMRVYLAQLTPRVDDIVTQTKTLSIGEAANRAVTAAPSGPGRKEAFVGGPDEDAWVADDEWNKGDDDKVSPA